jgi:hypothetical protein
MFLRGMLAGAAGIVVLDAYTYGDMLLRGRPASVVPSAVAKIVAQKLGVESLASDDAPNADNRRSGAGALFGYGVGIGAGAGYAALRPAFEAWMPWPIAGVLLGASTLVASEGGATALGATDWSTWSLADWVSDIVPRTLYGLTVAAVFHHLSEEW